MIGSVAFGEVVEEAGPSPWLGSAGSTGEGRTPRARPVLLPTALVARLPDIEPNDGSVVRLPWARDEWRTTPNRSPAHESRTEVRTAGARTNTGTERKASRMTNSLRSGMIAVLGSASLVTSSLLGQPAGGLSPSSMPRMGKVDDRFQSYNVEMVEVTGGRFWAPYKKTPAVSPAAPDPRATQTVLPESLSAASADMFAMRPPIDWYDARLRKLAAALAPAYVRVSGSWANATYFHDSDDPPPATPPKGFNGVLTRKQWKGVVDFSHAVDAKIISSFAGSDGVRDANGVWTPTEAQKVLEYTKRLNGEIAAVELFNEPNQGVGTGQGTPYSAAVYGRDFKVFLPFIRKTAPNTVVLGPGSSGEESSTYRMKSEDLMAAAGPGIDAFSYHFYGARAVRCSFRGPEKQTTSAQALSEDWLSKTDQAEADYRRIRDQFEPGKPVWLTETGGASCGATLGTQRSSIRSGTWINLAVSRSEAFRWWPTIPSPPATTL